MVLGTSAGTSVAQIITTTPQPLICMMSGKRSCHFARRVAADLPPKTRHETHCRGTADLEKSPAAYQVLHVNWFQLTMFCSLRSRLIRRILLSAPASSNRPRSSTRR
jgi:hypothetical protein